MPGGLAGSLGFIGRNCSIRLGLCGISYSVPKQCSSELEPSDLIIPGGSALLQVLEPDSVVSSDHRSPEGLPILSHLLKMHSLFIPERIRLEGHDGEVSVNEAHGGQAFIDRGSTLVCEPQLMRP